MADAESLIPEITDADIDEVCALMGLDDFDAPRRAFLKRRTTVDVSACPGSGKTTLIVAKLAILARKWPHRTRGICVLSHTNVAREQIEHRLGRTVVGQSLLGYPHFIDTIHGFVNRFLALPWLYSNGYPSPTIDDDVTTAYRRSVLGQDYHKVQAFLSNKYTGFDRLRLCGRDLSFDLGGKAFPSKTTAPSFKHAKRAVEAAAQAGYFCYDEMFVWANALLEDCPDLPAWLAHRFPLVILDEMQDTFDRQASFLNAVFPRSAGKIVVQRVGDPNQQIFDMDDPASGAAEPFPDTEPARCLGIPNSYRFGPDIAALASPFAVHAVEPSGLSGIGPKSPGQPAQQCRHAIFVFPNDSASGVLDAYGAYALETLGPELAANGLVTAVGHIHRDDPDVQPGHAYYPKTVGHYWDRYTVEISRKDPYPRTLAQYVRVAQGLIDDGRILSPGVEKLASGIIELARRMGDIGELKRKTRTHRAVSAALEDNAASLAAYQAFLRAFLVEKVALSEADWDARKDEATAIAAALCTGEVDTSKGARFLAWPKDDPSLGTGVASVPDDAPPNVFRYSNGVGSIDIRLGSIHSVKGQTHLATLLLNTNWYKAHSAIRMMPWLIGDKANRAGAGKQDVQRLLHTYVAMTRPSRLLCLAVPRSAIGDSQSFDQRAATLIGRGWRVAEIIDGETQWRD